MSHFEFLIPFKYEELLTTSCGSYCVKDFGSSATLLERLKDAKIGFEADGPEFIFEQFDTFFSVLYHAKKLETTIVEKGWQLISRAFNVMCQNLLQFLEDNNEIDEEIRIKYCNMLKMTVYLYIEFMHFYERKYYESQQNDDVMDKRRRRKKTADDDDEMYAWNNVKHNCLVKLYNLIRTPLSKLWSPPVVEETFINLISDFCYKCLEDPAIKNIKYLTDTVFEILGTLVKNYNHGFMCTVKLINIVKTREHACSVIAQGVMLLVNQYECKSLINRLVREIVEWQGNEHNMAQNVTETRQCATFLIELATVLPQEMIPEVTYLGNQLDNDSYTFRNSVLSIMAEVLTVFSVEGLSNEQKEHRNNFLDHLEEHFYDVSAFVRSKVLQLWGRLQRSQAIPLNRQIDVLNKCVERLSDKASNVRKCAINTIIAFLECNPFGSILDIDKYTNDLSCELKKLDEIKQKLSTSDLGEKTKEWMILCPSLQEFIEKKLQLESVTDADEANVTTSNCLTDAVSNLRNSLINKDFEMTFKLLRTAENVSNRTEERRKMEFKAQVNYFMMLLHKIFLNESDSNLDSYQNYLKDCLEELNVQEQVVQFLEECTNFLKCFSLGVDKIKILIKSKTVTESNEAMEFFVIANRFKIKGAFNGVLEMLDLMYCVELDRKESVSKALSSIWFSVNTESERVKAVEIVKVLIRVIQNIKLGHHEAFKQLIYKWVKSNDISPQEIKVLWEFFTMKIEGTSENDSRAALHLLGLVAEATPEIVSSNVNVLQTVGLGPRGIKDFRIVEETCFVLLRLGKIYKASNDKPPFRYKFDDTLVQQLITILKDGWVLENPCYISMTLKAVDVFYEICDKPDIICGQLYLYFHSQLSNSVIESTVSVNLLIQFVNFIGHVALRQLLYLDITVYKELKRRNEYRDKLEEEKNKKNKKVTRRESKKNNTTDSSVCSSASMMKNKSVLTEEEEAVEGAVAEDADAEYIMNICENSLLEKDSLLGNALNMIIKIIESPTKYRNENLQSACVLALTKMMCISSRCAEVHLQLLITVLEKSSHDVIRGNIIVALTDLLKRFPNVLDPWTPYMYKRLSDPSDDVRQKTVSMLSYLIMHELIRVKRYISDLALCIVDKNPRICTMTEAFFKQLSLKGNSLYNIMPDIISRFSDPEINISDAHFKTIMKYIMGLIQKDKHLESLIEKICFRFQLSTTAETQWSQLAYCLTLINYNEKGIRKLIDNISMFKDKLQNNDVYNSFKTIISIATKNAKPEMKTLAKELSEKIEECFKVNTEDDKSEDKSVRASQRTKKPRRKQTNNKSDSDEKSDECDESTVNKSVRTSQRTRKSYKKSKDLSDSENSSDSSEDERKIRKNKTDVFKKPMSVRKRNKK